MAEEQHDLQVIHIWDDPESRIAFLETILKKEHWQAVIYQPTAQDHQTPGAVHSLTDLAKTFKEKGYEVELGADQNGIPTLSLKNFGSSTSLIGFIKQRGLVKGVGRKLTDIGEPLGVAMNKTSQLFKHIAGDKARLIGGMYMLGDLFLVGSGFSNKAEGHGHNGLAAMKDPANALQTTAGVCATLQSLIYMGFAKEGSEAMFSELMKKAEKASAEGKDLLNVEEWKNVETERKHGGPVGLVQRLLRNHPLQAGAGAMLLGQMGLLASGGIRLKRSLNPGAGTTMSAQELGDQRKGAISDMVTAVNSLTGWSLMMKPERAAHSKRPWMDIRRLWDEVQSAPNKFASAFLGVASLAGVGAAASKHNKLQMMGNMSYLAGDGVMFVTKGDSYGSQGRSNAELLAEAAARFVEVSPIVMGKEQQANFVKQLSDYISERSLTEQARKTKKAPTDEEVQALSARISEVLASKIPAVNAKAMDVAGTAAEIVSHFHPEFADKIAGALARSLCEVKSVVIEPDELKEYILGQVDKSKEASAKIVQMRDIIKPLSELVFSVPGAANADVVNHIYDSVDEYVRPSPANAEQLEAALNAKAAIDMGFAAPSQVGSLMARQLAATPSLAPGL